MNVTLTFQIECGETTIETEPRVCPKCKSPYWNKPRKATAKKKTEKK